MTAPAYPFGRALREGFRLAAPVLAALALGAYVASMQLDVVTRQPFRLLAFLPVALAAYRRRGLLPGLAYAAGFGLLYLWEAAWAITAGGLTEQQPEAIAATLFLVAVAIVFAGIAEGRRSREALRDRAEDRRQLLDRAHSLAEVAAFVRQEAQRDAYAHDAALLLRGEDADGWHLLAEDRALPLSANLPDAQLSLAAWLVKQARQVVIDDLDADPRFAGRSDIRSVMSLPLWGLDGMLQGLLVLLDRRPARFSAIDLARLDALAEAAGAALTQAGAFAVTERSLQRLASRLTAIERAARDLNSRLDRQTIAEKGLSYARLVTAAGTSVILVTSGPEPPACEAAGRAVTPALRAILQRGAALPAAIREPAEATRGERLLAPIRRGELSLGALLVEGPQGAFEPYDVQVLATLAEHLGVALENAALLAAVRYERERAEQVIENTADGLVVLDAGGRVVRMNRAAARLTGWQAAEATGRLAAELLAGDGRVSRLGQQESTLSGGRCCATPVVEGAETGGHPSTSLAPSAAGGRPPAQDARVPDLTCPPGDGPSAAGTGGHPSTSLAPSAAGGPATRSGCALTRDGRTAASPDARGRATRAGGERRAAAAPGRGDGAAAARCHGRGGDDALPARASGNVFP